MKKEADRQKSSLIFEGMTSFRAVLKSDSRKILHLWFDKTRADKKSRELEFIRRMSKEHGFILEMCDREVIDTLATGTSHGGVIFECTERIIPDITEFKPDTETDGIKGFYMMLEGIEDPYNFGYALRSAYAAGVAGVILSPRNWMSAAGVVCRASAGASELLPMYIGNAEDAAKIFKDNGYSVICAGIRDSVPVYDCDLTRPILFIVGGEKRGISASVLALADDIVRLDYGRAFNGSLSAASAASILAYEVLRQHGTNERNSI